MRALRASPGRLWEKVHILLIDDDRDLRESIADGLVALDAQVTQAGSAEEAWTRLGESTFDLMVSDINLPGEDGHSLLAHLRRLPDPRAELPAIAITGRVDGRCDGSGFARVLEKPFELEVLVRAICALLTERQARLTNENLTAP